MIIYLLVLTTVSAALVLAAEDEPGDRPHVSAGLVLFALAHLVGAAFCVATLVRS